MDVLLTAYNEKVQEYNAAPDKSYKKKRIESLEEAVRAAGSVFERLFSFSKKRVIDEIIYLASGSGICKIGGDKLAEKCGVSIRTVRAAVAALKKTDEFVVARLANERAGKYVFVDKSHPDYAWIMHDVFGVDARLNARQIARLQNAEKVDATASTDDKTALNGFSSNSSKQALKNINNIYNSAHTHESEKLKSYAGQDAFALFERLSNDATMSEIIVAEAYNIALAYGDCSEKQPDVAYDTLRKINYDLSTHLRANKSIRSIFLASYERNLYYAQRNNQMLSEQLRQKYEETYFTLSEAAFNPF